MAKNGMEHAMSQLLENDFGRLPLHPLKAVAEESWFL